MKCAIVTVYNSPNCGSYLQAYALSKKVEQLGHDSSLVEHHFCDQSSSSLSRMKKTVKLLLKGRFSALRLYEAKNQAFKKAVSKLTVKRRNEDADCYILGSDTVWDLAVKYFYNHRSFFWGLDFNKGKVISYAASLGYAKEDVAHCDMVPKALQNMEAISVREDSARAILQPYTDKEIAVVCDPTLLLSTEDYAELMPTVSYRDYILIYHYGKMPAEYISAIRKIAEKENLQVISIGEMNDWCDVCLPHDPGLFLSMYQNATYVVTGTFHGTVFSHIFERRFAVIDSTKNKVIDFLKKHGTLDIIAASSDLLETVLHSDFDYAAVRKVIVQERAEGEAYLKNSIKE